MTLYIILIIISNFAIIGFNFAFSMSTFSFPIWYVIVASFGMTLSVIIVDLIVAFLVHKIPQKRLPPFKKIFIVGKYEKKFYEKIKIKKWKEKIPELGGLLRGFSKSKIECPNDNNYVLQYIQESIYGGLCHIACAFFGFVIIFFLPLNQCLCFSIPVAFVNATLNILPVFVLRYNRYKLNILYTKNNRKTINS